jgi:polar amino acid transport system ATP-binding protein
MVAMIDPPVIPVIDLSLFDLGDPWRSQVAAQIDSASTQFGCFCIVGHGIDVGFVEPVLAAGRRFFATEDALERRAQVAHYAGAGEEAFAPIEELAMRTSELKSFFFEAQLTMGNAPVTSATPGYRQSFLPDVPGLRDPVLDYMRSLTGLSHKLMTMVARGLRLEDSYFVDRYTGSPTTSFKVLHYPQVTNEAAATDTVSRGHQDPGLLTLLKQDAGGGLELNYHGQWLEPPAVPNSFICNLGQALARLTNGRYMSSAHRVRNSTTADRLAMVFSFDPTLKATLEPIAGIGPPESPLTTAAGEQGSHRQIA